MLMQVFVQLDLNYERAEKLYEAAVERAPRAMWWRGMMAGVHLREGRVDEALRLNELEVANGIEIIKVEFLPHHVLVLRAGARYESSLEVTEDALELIHGGRQRAGLLANKANVLLDLGRIDEAGVALSEGWQIGRYDAAEIFAVAFARIGEPDRARAALAAAYEPRGLRACLPGTWRTGRGVRNALRWHRGARPLGARQNAPGVLE